MAFYTRTNEEHWLRDKLEEGRTLILDDESIWEVHPSDREITQRWLRISSITVKATEKGSHPYLLSNRTRERTHGQITLATLPGRTSRAKWLNPQPHCQRGDFSSIARTQPTSAASLSKIKAASYPMRRDRAGWCREALAENHQACCRSKVPTSR